jgi:hypothetical protein
VIESALVDTATVPVHRGGTTVVAMVVPMITARRGAWMVASLPGICTGCSEADAEQSCNTDSG